MMFMIMTSMSILFMNHPLSMGFLILMHTILTCLNMGSFSMNFWYSYILILIMIGGLLVLFIYMTSIASNEKFKINIMMLIFLMLIFMIIIYLMMKMNPKMMELLMKNNFTFKMNNEQYFFYSMSKYYNYPFNKLMIFSILYLLISMIISVKICKIKSGPLRQLF
uniref:NADH-ubiquinone oxidoreductase chain 6 n=1 Tax=Scymninae sp. 4 ACP-2013 TaxID=1434585 RepID=A0A3G3FWZ3_9CUCU|nr:NADH dehydrogenase subunit 6 [Scymninae sp. 4 ACP-2013]